MSSYFYAPTISAGIPRAAAPPVVPPSGIQPDEIASLSTWLDGEGYSAGVWTPEVGSYAPSQATGSKQPTSGPSGAFGGQTTVLFDGVNDALTASGAVLPLPPYTLTATYKGNTSGYYTCAYFTSGYHAITADIPNDLLKLESPVLAGMADLEEVHHWTFVHDGTQLHIYRDNKWQRSITPMALSGSNTLFWLGAPGGSGFGGFELAELITFSTALTPEQREGLWIRARDRYAINTDYPARDLWICWGDSTCAGRGNISEAPVGYEPADGTLWMLKDTGAVGWQELNEPCGDGANDANGVGPCGLFAWKAQQETLRETAVVNAGAGGSQTSEWLPSEVSSSYYQRVLQRSLAALGWPGVTFRGFIVVIGPNDAYFHATPAWSANYDSTMAALKAALGLTGTDKPTLLVQLQTTVPTDSTYPGWAYTTSAIASKADANTLIVTPPEGPWREGYKLHRSTPAEDVLSDSLLTAAMGHASWA